MVLVLVVGAAIGGFMHLRSVDPVAERDREVAADVLKRMEQAGFAVRPQGSAPALRAGFRQHDMRFDFIEEADNGGGGEAGGEAGLPTRCSFQSEAEDGEGPLERLNDRLFGVGDPSNKELTSFSSATITSAGSPLEGSVNLVLLFTVKSADSGREVLQQLASTEAGDCVNSLFAAGARGTPGTVTPLAVPFEGTVGYRGDAALASGVTASFDLVALHRGRAVAFLMSGGLEPRASEAPIAVLGPLAANMQQSFGGEV